MRKGLFVAFWFALLVSCSGAKAPEFENTYLFDEPKNFSGFEIETASGVLGPEALKDKLTLIFFGFTSCPDICPMELTQLASGMDELDENDLAKLQAMFISVDPEKDNLQIITDYAKFFHPKMIGGRIENPAKLLNLTTQLGAYYEKVFYDSSESEDQAKNYTMNHTASLVVINPAGQYAGISPSPHDITKLRQDIQSLIRYYFK